MKFLLKLLKVKLFPNRRRSVDRKSDVRESPAPEFGHERRGSSHDEDLPKNGRLTLAVLGASIILIILAVLNINFIRNPAIAKKAFGPMLASEAQEPIKETKINNPVKTGVPSKRPDITFYDTLKTLDAPPGKSEQSDVVSAKEVQDPDGTCKIELDKSKVASKEQKSAGRPANQVILPNVKGKMYTVQVGAFSQPSIAVEWAKKWKSKGFEVTLKPMARPKMGVIYQLYLGKFKSEHEADELVNRLKSREGISAIRLSLLD